MRHVVVTNCRKLESVALGRRLVQEDLTLVSGTCSKKKTILIPSLAMLEYKAKQNLKEI